MEDRSKEKIVQGVPVHVEVEPGIFAIAFHAPADGLYRCGDQKEYLNKGQGWFITAPAGSRIFFTPAIMLAE